jgi:hypothetical protein
MATIGLPRLVVAGVGVGLDERIEVLTRDVAAGADQDVSDLAAVDQVVNGALGDAEVFRCGFDRKQEAAVVVDLGWGDGVEGALDGHHVHIGADRRPAT